MAQKPLHVSDHGFQLGRDIDPLTGADEPCAVVFMGVIDAVAALRISVPAPREAIRQTHKRPFLRLQAHQELEPTEAIDAPAGFAGPADGQRSRTVRAGSARFLTVAAMDATGCGSPVLAVGEPSRSYWPLLLS